MSGLLNPSTLPYSATAF